MGLTLSKKATNRDKKALKKFIIENSEYIYKLAFIHTKYEEDAKTIMKNTISCIDSSINKLSIYGSLKTFIIKVTIKHINEYLEEVGMVEEENNNEYYKMPFRSHRR